MAGARARTHTHALQITEAPGITGVGRVVEQRKKRVERKAGGVRHSLTKPRVGKCKAEGGKGNGTPGGRAGKKGRKKGDGERKEEGQKEPQHGGDVETTARKKKKKKEREDKVMRDRLDRGEKKRGAECLGDMRDSLAVRRAVMMADGNHSSDSSPPPACFSAHTHTHTLLKHSTHLHIKTQCSAKVRAIKTSLVHQ